MGEVTPRDFDELRRAQDNLRADLLRSQDKLEESMLRLLQEKDAAHRRETGIEFEARDKASATTLAAEIRRLDTEATQLGKHLETLNHAHAQSLEDRKGFIAKDEHLAMHSATDKELQTKMQNLDDKIDTRFRSLESTRDITKGSLWVWGIVVGYIITIGLAIVAVILR